MQPLIRNQSKMPPPARALMLAEALGWGAAGIVLARALWLAVTPAGPLGTPPVAAAAAASPLALAGIDPFYPGGAAAPADAVSGLDLVLVGTRVDAASARGSAIIAGPDGRQQSYGVGDEIMPGVRLVAVSFEAITLDRGGARETLYIDQSPAGADMPMAPPLPVAPEAPQAPQAASPAGASAQ